jgi:CheY-like chemotaxis protein
MTERTVLIVDDDSDIREIVQFALEMQPGWKVVGEQAGENAVERAVAVRPDVILLDVNLEGMDGPATLGALRADDRTAGIPVLFLTANNRPADVDRLQALGAKGVLAKPFDPLALGSQVSRAMHWPE